MIDRTAQDVVVDGQVLLDFVKASKDLQQAFVGPDVGALHEHGDANVKALRRKLERWEIAHTTLCGNVRPA